MVDADFTGRRIVVTGATGGIGRRVCAQIGGLGGEVFVVGRNADELKRVDGEVNADASTTQRVFVADFARQDSTNACARALEGMPIPLDGVVVIVPSVPKCQATMPIDSDWRQALDLCFVNPLTVLGACIAKLGEGGRVVIVSGIASVEVFPSLPFSNVIRLAWLAESKRLSFVLGTRRIRVNTLSLGATLTERFRRRLVDRSEHDVPARESPETIPLGEYGDPDEAAYVVVLLLSRFANHITGTNIVFDGGITRSY